MKPAIKCLVHAPWPDDFPEGKVVPENERFLERTELFRIGLVGIFDQCLCLPEGVLWHSSLGKVLMARTPYDKEEWKTAFHPLPFYLEAAVPPFEEFEHVADIAFRIHGENLNHILLNAQYALAFKCVDLIPFLQEELKITTIEEGIIYLNAIVSEADQSVGTPFKAVSFHGKVEEKEGILTWEMIVDV